MKLKELIFKRKIKFDIMLVYNYLKLEIEQTMKENKPEGEAKIYAGGYLEGYLKGVEDFKDSLMKHDVEILKE